MFTLPQPTDPDVLQFLALWGLPDPIFLDYVDVGAGYSPDFCHVSANHRVSVAGGRRVLGWALWQFPQCVLGNCHSVWEDPTGNLIDVTPPKLGTRTLFVADSSLSITWQPNRHRLYNNRTNVAGCPMLDLIGECTADPFFPMPDSNPSLIGYCSGLGLPTPAKSMI
ncbi:MAG: hypothetical protein KF730_04470 [Sphingomonas sp.]|uniref:hypothetical protein n=1 Tax=Sphingomonas sp. TaxID=28214 RepID=UPI0025D20A0F|nr:hypothetical protein [Sphingomonas sp.]MBX3563814.1 hypothetical protein [Sphingomonas sp.]